MSQPRAPLLLLILSGLSACDADFDVARGELGPFRVAALGVELRPDGSRVASAAVWSGLGLYHEASPTLRWSLDGEALGEGWEVLVPEQGALGLLATSPDGEELQAQVELADPPPALELARGALTLGEDLSLEARRAADVLPVDGAAAAGEVARLSLSFADGTASGDYSARWMLAEDAGTLLEVEAMAADVLAEEIVWDDGEVEERIAAEATLYPTLALVLDGAGSNRWIWADAAIGLDTPLLRHEGRLLPLSQADAAEVISAGASAGYVAATLVSREDLLGVGLEEVAAVPAVDGEADLSAQDTLSCAPTGEPFRLAWVAEGRCPRPDVLGARVVLEVW